MPTTSTSPDSLFTVTSPGGINISVNASDVVSALLTAQGAAIDHINDFNKVLEVAPEASGAFGLLGLAAGAVISALENNAQGMDVDDNFQKTVLDGAASYTGAEIGGYVGALFGPLLPGGILYGAPAGALIGGFVGGVISNNVYPYIQAQLLASKQAGAVQAAWGAGLPYTLTPNTPGVPSVNFYANGLVVIPSLGVTFGPGGSVTTPTGSMQTSYTGASPNFSSQFTPNDGSAPTTLSGQVAADDQGNVTTTMQVTDANGVAHTSGPVNMTDSPNNPVQESFDPDTQTTYLSLTNPDPTQGWYSIQLSLNNTVVTKETVTDRALNTFTFGYDGNGAVDVEVITQFNTPTQAIYSFDTLNQQSWTSAETLFSSGQPVASYYFNRDGTVTMNNFVAGGQLGSNTVYTTNVGALETVWDTVGNQTYSAYQVQMNVSLQTTAITQYERNGDTYVDQISPTNGLVMTDTHYRANGGNTTVTSNDWGGTETWASVVSDYTSAGSAIDTNVFNHDQSTVVYKYNTGNGQVQEVDQFLANTISQTYIDTTGSLPWSSLINSFNAQGTFLGETIYNRNGTVSFISTGSVTAPAAPSISAAAGSPGTQSTTPLPGGLYVPPPVTISAPVSSPALTPSSGTANFNTPTDPTIPQPTATGASAPTVTDPFQASDPGADPGGSGIPVELGVTPDGPIDVDPLVVNLKGAVRTTSGSTNGVTFDLTGTGVLQQVGWLTKGEGFLVSDPKLTPVTNGTQWLASVANLTPFDTNHDGVINTSDAGFKQLDLWVPGAQGGTVASLTDLGITAIDLTFKSEDIFNNGNTITKVFSVIKADGTTGQGAEVNLASVAKSTPTTSNLFYTPPATPLLPVISELRVQGPEIPAIALH